MKNKKLGFSTLLAFSILFLMITNAMASSNLGITTIGYPAQIGYPQGSTSADNGSGNIICTPITLASAEAPASYVGMGLYIDTATPTGQLRFGVYNNTGTAPHKLQAESASQNATHGWNYILFITTLPTGGTYWLCFQGQAHWDIPYTYPVAGSQAYASQAYGAFPATYSGSGTNTYQSPIIILKTSLEGYIKATKITVTQTVIVNSLTLYHSAGGGSQRAAIYNSSLKLIWEQPSDGLSAAQWTNYPTNGGTPTSLVLTAGTYWLACQYQYATGLYSGGPTMATGTNGDGWYRSQSYGAFPATVTGQASSDEKWSIYITVDNLIYSTSTTLTTVHSTSTIPTRTTSATYSVYLNSEPIYTYLMLPAIKPRIDLVMNRKESGMATIINPIIIRFPKKLGLLIMVPLVVDVIELVDVVDHVVAVVLVDVVVMVVVVTSPNTFVDAIASKAENISITVIIIIFVFINASP